MDTWSLVANGREWIAHEWLGEVVMTLFYKTFGLFGLTLFRTVCVTILISALAYQIFRRTTPYRATLCLTLAIFATVDGWGERPQLLSFLLLIPAAYLVNRSVAGRMNPFWLVPATWLWANIHAFWVIMIALIGVGVLGILMRDGWAGGRDRAARMVTVALTCLAVAGLTPNGPALYAPLINHAGSDPSFIVEFGPPTIQRASGLAFFAMIALFLWLHARALRRPDAYELAQVLFAFFLGLLYLRTVAPAAILLTPLLADAFSRSRADANTVKRRMWSQKQATGLGAVLVLSMLGMVVRAASLPVYSSDAPVKATAALEAATPGVPRVINEYGIGGWLLERAPSTRPAIDGRAEIFPPGYVRAYIDALAMRGDWRATIEPLAANTALLRPRTALVNGLRDDWGWRTVYEDKNWVVLTTPNV